MSDFEHWKYYVGIKNCKDEELTKDMLNEWAKDPNRKVECIFCGSTYPDETWACSRCKEYKGIQPYIEDWSDWG